VAGGGRGERVHVPTRLFSLNFKGSPSCREQQLLAGRVYGRRRQRGAWMGLFVRALLFPSNCHILGLKEVTPSPASGGQCWSGGCGGERDPAVWGAMVR
jgi:hypothetical protein